MTDTRTSLAKRVRFAVLTRDEFTCYYCRATREDGVRLTVDHVVPVALGGTDEPSNLVTACEPCNSGKSSTSPTEEIVEEVKDDAVRWAAAMQAAADEIRARREAAQEHLARWEKRWCAWTWTDSKGEKHNVDRPVDWQNSVEAVLAAGADLDTLIDFIEVAMQSKAKDVFRYWCGCAWNHVRAVQDRARQLLANAPGRACRAPVLGVRRRRPQRLLDRPRRWLQHRLRGRLGSRACRRTRTLRCPRGRQGAPVPRPDPATAEGRVNATHPVHQA